MQQKYIFKVTWLHSPEATLKILIQSKVHIFKIFFLCFQFGNTAHPRDTLFYLDTLANYVYTMLSSWWLPPFWWNVAPVFFCKCYIPLKVKTTTHKTLWCHNQGSQNPYSCYHKNLKSSFFHVDFYKALLFGIKAQIYLALYIFYA